jgi:predicted ester cyclase
LSEENKAIVRRQEEELFTQGNLDAADEVYAPDYVGHDPSNLEHIQGLEAAKQAADYRKAFPDLRVTVKDVIAEGDKVAARLRFRGTHRGELDGIAPTGRRVDCTGIVISRMEGGKIVEDWANFDDLGMMQQLGAISKPGHQPFFLAYSPECVEGVFPRSESLILRIPGPTDS